MAISFPSPFRRRASRSAWPPAPKVQSITVSPGRGSRFVTTSSARTGTWSASVGKTLGNIFRSPFIVRLPGAPGSPIPDLQVIPSSEHRHVALELRAPQQRCRNHHAALPVELALRGGAEEDAPHHPRALGKRVEAADPVGQDLPL